MLQRVTRSQDGISRNGNEIELGMKIPMINSQISQVSQKQKE
jgi:hypothetical protein